ncbi:YggS family pyridoxal phosphate-dependent enzyme [Criibacterium bergeronii]|uniref:Pyridoxal phosphate homeostasis protein n=1 Tax=Criibacterium bergeronii TaxID=1871336 RepID=A0A552VCV2_9FIRM|nr:YggS family pyridoxal phosphate-dependent enzyme [Criibacterium bergeronii]TRW28308.1 YggS family pyridoxal phosphate-dependent enzyme [Criibacterium bergeronii]
MSEDLKQNLEKVQYLIGEAKSKSPYKQEVKLISVSKTVDMPEIKQIYDLGIRDFGENKPQELARKSQELTDANWHQIGTLQKNKVKYIIDRVRLIHSVDSLSLAQEIDKRAKQLDITINCLLQINISHEESKHGIEEKDVIEFVKNLQQYKNISLIGLMGMAPYESDKEKTRPYFQRMKEIISDVNSKKIYGSELTELSMGMSNDFQIAIEEGATMVRIGTSIFGERTYK